MKNSIIEKVQAPQLPKDILQSDFKYPAWDSGDKMVAHFELWYAKGMGWVIPTLLIRHSRRADRADRTYATSLLGEPCRVGLGPHILAQHTVYVRASRKEALQKYLDLQLAGQQTSNEIRDRISTRRARTALRRRDFFGGLL